MYELSKDEIHQAIPLLSGPVHCPEAAGVVLGHSVGWVYADRSPNPTSALVWVHGQKGFFCLGDWTNTQFLAEIARASVNELGRRVQSYGVKWFEVSGDSPEWDGALLSAFTTHGIPNVQTEFQYVYGYGRPRWREVSDRASARRIDAALLSSDIGNRDFIHGKLLENWVTLEEFFRVGVGFCRTVDGRVASICFSGSVGGSVHAIAVETLPEFRRRGFARSTSAALLEEYDRRDISPYWGVMPGNEGSIAIAESLGLIRTCEYSVHYFRLEADCDPDHT